MRKFEYIVDNDDPDVDEYEIADVKRRISIRGYRGRICGGYPEDIEYNADHLNPLSGEQQWEIYMETINLFAEIIHMKSLIAH